MITQKILCMAVMHGVACNAEATKFFASKSPPHMIAYCKDCFAMFSPKFTMEPEITYEEAVVKIVQES